MSKSYLRVNRDQLLSDANAVKQGSLANLNIETYPKQVSDGTPEGTYACLYNRVNPDQPIKIVNNNCLTLPSTYLYFADDDISPNVSKIDFWINLRDATKSHGIWSLWDATNKKALWLFIDSNPKQIGWREYTLQSDGTLKSPGYNTFSATGGKLVANTWYHIIFDRNNSSIRIFGENFNGTQIKSTFGSYTTTTTTDWFSGIGGYRRSASGTFSPNFSVMEFKMYDSEDNLLHYFPMQEGESDKIYDIVTDAVGRIAVKTKTSTYYATRDEIKSYWANKQDLFAHNTVNGYYKVNATSTPVSIGEIPLNLKLPCHKVCLNKSIPGNSNNFGRIGAWHGTATDGTLTLNYPSPYDKISYTATAGLTVCKRVVRFNQGRLSYLANVEWYYGDDTYGYPRKQFNNTEFKIKFHYKVTCADRNTKVHIQFLTYPNSSGIVSIVSGNSSIEITDPDEGDKEVILSSKNYKAGIYQAMQDFEFQLSDISESNPLAADLTLEISNIECQYYGDFFCKHMSPVLHGLNHSEASLQFPDGTIYNPTDNILEDKAPIYRTIQTGYGEQNHLQYTQVQSGTDLLRIENKLNNLTDGKTLITKPTVNYVYPEMYGSIIGSNWTRGGCDNFSGISSISVKDKTIIYRNAESNSFSQVSYIYWGTYSTKTANGYCSFKADKVRASVDGAKWVIDKTTYNAYDWVLRVGYISKSTGAQTEIEQVAVLNSTSDNFIEIDLTSNTDVKEIVYVIPRFRLQNTITASSTSSNTFTITNLCIDLVEFESVNMWNHDINETNTPTNNNLPLIRFPQDPEYQAIEV